jgi:predicted nucleotidyltransferase
MKNIIARIKKLDKDRKILFVALYGSYAKKSQNKMSDIDLAVYYKGNEKERFRFRINLAGELGDKYDVRIFQDLPLYMRNEVIKSGKILYKRDMQKLREIYIKTIREYSGFEKYIERYYRSLRGEALA